MKTKKERKALLNKFKKLIKAESKSLDDIKKVENEGAEILQQLIDGDILKEVKLKLGKNR